jgi:hypothetical protein
MTRRKVDLAKKRSKAIEAALADSGLEATIDEISFVVDGKEYRSVDKISHNVGMHIGRLGNEDYSNAAQSESLVYALTHLIHKDDRKGFSTWLEESEMTTADMITMLGSIIEEIVAAPLDSSTSAGAGSKKTSTKRMGTLSEVVSDSES